MAQEMDEAFETINIDNTMTALSTSKYIVTNQNGETIYQGNTMPMLENEEGHTIYILEDSMMDVQTESEVSTLGVPSEVNLHLTTVQNTPTHPPVGNVFSQEPDQNIVIEMAESQGPQIQEVPGLGQCLVQIVPGTTTDDMHLFQLTEKPIESVINTLKPSQTVSSVAGLGSPLISLLPNTPMEKSQPETQTALLPGTNKRVITVKDPGMGIKTLKTEHGNIQIIIPEPESQPVPLKPKLKLVPLVDSSIFESSQTSMTAAAQPNSSDSMFTAHVRTDDHCDHPYGSGTGSVSSSFRQLKSSTSNLCEESHSSQSVSSAIGLPSMQTSISTSVSTQQNTSQPISPASEVTTEDSTSLEKTETTNITASKPTDIKKTEKAIVTTASTTVHYTTMGTRSKSRVSTVDYAEMIANSSSNKKKPKVPDKNMKGKVKEDSDKPQNNSTQERIDSVSEPKKDNSKQIPERYKQGRLKGKFKATKKSNLKKKRQRFMTPAPPPKELDKKKNREKYKPMMSIVPPPGSFVQTQITIDDNSHQEIRPVSIVKVEPIDEDDKEQIQNAKARQLKEDVNEELKKTSDCRLCGSLHNTKLCPLFTRRPKVLITDSLEHSNSGILALQSLPQELLLTVSRPSHGFGIFTKESIVRGTHFGPLVGEPVEFASIHHKSDLRHIWIIDTEDLLQHKFISAENELTSNWCRYLRSSLNVEECNLVSYSKENDDIRFVAKQDLNEGEELVVYFHFLEDMYEELWFNDLLNRKERYCRRCEITFTDLVCYVKHVKIFHPQGLKSLKAECKVCHVILQSTKELTKHCVEKHGGRGAFVCQDCGKHFALPSFLRQHRNFHHIYEGEIKCDECGRVFINRFKLKNHIRMKHSGEEFVCHYCSKKLGTRCALNRHRKMHEENVAYTCPRCGKLCRDSTNLKTHMLTHSGLRPFQCVYDFCVAGFTTKHSLIGHYKKIHRLSDADIPEVKRTIPYTLEAYSGATEGEKINIVKTRVNKKMMEAQVQTDLVYDLLNSDEEQEFYAYTENELNQS